MDRQQTTLLSNIIIISHFERDVFADYTKSDHLKANNIKTIYM
jgi:hypothetical protein